MASESTITARVANAMIYPSELDVPLPVPFPTPASDPRGDYFQPLPDHVEHSYEAKARDPKYAHFVHIPDRILRCLDYFGIECDRTLAKARLHAYYLFIGVVDNEIDSGHIESGRVVLRRLSTRVPCYDEEIRDSDLKLMTEVLKSRINGDSYPLILDKLRVLYREVIQERTAASLDKHIEHRRRVGSLTAELSYLLIRPSLKGDHLSLCQFMKQVGAVGCLVDSLIDLSTDHRLGLLGFEPAPMDYAKLLCCTLRDGWRMLSSHPRLLGPFLQAIGDNIRDRFRRDRSCDAPVVTERKGRAASVA